MGVDSPYPRGVRLLRVRSAPGRDHWTSLDSLDVAQWNIHHCPRRDDGIDCPQPPLRGADRNPPLGSTNCRTACRICWRVGAVAADDFAAHKSFGLANCRKRLDTYRRTM